MSSSQYDDGFGEETYSALAEVIYLDEPIPEHLQPLWEYVAHHSEDLARLEEHRIWNALIAEMLIAEHVSLVLAVTLVETAWQVQVRRQVGRKRQFLGVTSRVGTRGKRDRHAAVAVVEFDGFAVEVEPDGDTVKLTVFSNNFETAGLEVQALDLSGQRIDGSITDVCGSVTLKVPGRTTYELMLKWPECVLH